MNCEDYWHSTCIVQLDASERANLFHDWTDTTLLTRALAIRFAISTVLVCIVLGSLKS